MDNSNPDKYFEFKTYEQFRDERLKLNHESTLKLWYSLSTDLSSIDNKLAKRQTIQQQRARLRKMKFFAFYCTFLKKTCLKKKIYAKGKQNFTYFMIDEEFNYLKCTLSHKVVSIEKKNGI